MKMLAEAPEQQIFELLSMLSLSDIIGILTKLTSDLPDHEREFYAKEVDTWGSSGNKAILINDIIELVDAAGVIDIVDSASTGSFEEFHHAALKFADRRYDDNSRSDWSPGTTTPRTHPAPSVPDVMLEKDRVRKTPTYKDPDLFKKDWELGEGPQSDDTAASFAFDELDSGGQHALRKELEKGILMGLSIPNVPKPYVLDMVSKWLQTSNPEKLKKLVDFDDFESRSAWGRSKPYVLNKMFEEKPPLEELYSYWNSIVNHRHMPLVNTEYVDARFNSGEMVNNVKMFENWENSPNDALRNPISAPAILSEIARGKTIEDIDEYGEVEDIPDISDIVDPGETVPKPPHPKKPNVQTDYDNILESFPEIMEELGLDEEFDEDFDEFM